MIRSELLLSLKRMQSCPSLVVDKSLLRLNPPGPGMIKTVDPRHKLTFDTTEMLVPSLISFGPLIVTVSGWAKAYRARRIEPLHPFAFTLLVVITALAAVPAGSFIYFRLRPVHHLPPWQNPEVAFSRVVLPARTVLRGPRISCVSQ